MSHGRPRRLFAWLWLRLVGAALLLGMTGCPGGAELEHPEKYGPTFAGTGATGAIAGSGGSGGSSSYPLPVLACDYQQFVGAGSASGCGKRGCHGAPSASLKPGAGLNLTLDDGFVSRLKDVPSTHLDIYCGNVACDAPPDACPQGDLLIDSADYTQSWLLTKVKDAAGCGELMPVGSSLSAADLSCFEELVKTIADLP